MSGHTKGPWVLDPNGVITATAGTNVFNLICVMARPMQIPEVAANASFILRAVNSHDALLEALEACSSCLSDMMNDKGGWAWEEVLDQAEAALKKAKP